MRIFMVPLAAGGKENAGNTAREGDRGGAESSDQELLASSSTRLQFSNPAFALVYLV